VINKYFVLLSMESVYHIVVIRVNETSLAHVWSLRFRYHGTGYDNSLVQTELLVAYVNIWQSTLSQTIVALVEMMSSKFICLFWLR
jgi:hypothetical protein